MQRYLKAAGVVFLAVLLSSMFFIFCTNAQEESMEQDLVTIAVSQEHVTVVGMVYDAGQEVQLIILDSSYDFNDTTSSTIWSGQTISDNNGCFIFDVNMPETAPTGTYYAMISYNGLEEEIIKSFQYVNPVECAQVLHMINNVTNIHEMESILVNSNHILQLELNQGYESLPDEWKSKVIRAIVGYNFKSIEEFRHIFYEVVKQVEKDRKSSGGSGGGSSSKPASDSIMPVFQFDKSVYRSGDIVELSLVLYGVDEGDKTNSVILKVRYDSEKFELVTGDVNIDVIDGYLEFTDKNVKQEDGESIIELLYTSPDDTILQEGERLFTIRLRVKETAQAGEAVFVLYPVEMLDTNNHIYDVADGEPVIGSVMISNYAVVKGIVSIYLGDEESEFNQYLLDRIKPEQIDRVFNHISIIAENSEDGSAISYSGQEVFLKDENGNIGVISGNKVMGRYEVRITNMEVNRFSIGGTGYLNQSYDIELDSEFPLTIGDDYNPVVLYPGDLAKVDSGLVMEPDGKISNADFSAWLQIYKESVRNTADEYSELMADFTRDGVINNVDFSLWLASYKKVLNGTDDPPVFPVTELYGQVVANSNVDLSPTKDAEDGQVVIRVRKTDGTLEDMLFEAAHTNAESLIGYNVIFTIDDNKICTIRKDSNNEVVVPYEYIYSVEHVGMDRMVFSYWRDPEHDARPRELKLSEQVRVIYNGKLLESFDVDDLMPTTGKVVLLDTDDDNEYDFVIVTEYWNFIVDEVNIRDYEIYGKNGEHLILNDTDVKVYFIKDAQKILIEDLNEFDVLSVAESKDGELITIYVSDRKISGTVVELWNDYDGGIYMNIYGQGAYKLAYNAVDLNKVLGLTADFYLDVEGRIAYIDKTPYITFNYAYLLDAALTSGLSRNLQVKVLNEKGEIRIFESSSKITFNGLRIDAQDAFTLLMESSSNPYGYGIKRQLIHYELDSSGKIKKIDTAQISDDEEIFSLDVSRSILRYEEISNKLGSYYIDGDTCIFVIEPDDCFVAPHDILKNNAYYDVEIYDLDKDGVAGAVVVYNLSSAIVDAEYFLVVGGSRALNDDGENIYKFEGTVNGKNGIIIIPDDLIEVEIDSKKILHAEQ